MKHFKMLIGLILCMKNFINLFRMMCGELVPGPKGGNVIGTKWIFKNKLDEHGTIIRNKSRLVAQEYTQVEGIDFDETFALVARMESIRILLVIASHLNFKLC